jgi:hypothetical protein
MSTVATSKRPCSDVAERSLHQSGQHCSDCSDLLGERNSLRECRDSIESGSLLATVATYPRRGFETNSAYDCPAVSKSKFGLFRASPQGRGYLRVAGMGARVTLEGARRFSTIFQSAILVERGKRSRAVRRCGLVRIRPSPFNNLTKGPTTDAFIPADVCGVGGGTERGRVPRIPTVDWLRTAGLLSSFSPVPGFKSLRNYENRKA